MDKDFTDSSLLMVGMWYKKKELGTMEKILLEQEMEVKNSLSPILVLHNKSILFLNRKCTLEAYQPLIVFTMMSCLYY
jgi:hypothetical protein